jgi:hypothetical protein
MLLATDNISNPGGLSVDQVVVGSTPISRPRSPFIKIMKGFFVGIWQFNHILDGFEPNILVYYAHQIVQ